MKKGIKSSIFVLVAVLLVMGTVLAGCGKNAGKSDEQVFRFNLHSEPPSLDPGLAQDNTSFTVLKGIYEGLTRMNDKGAAEPAVAEKWEVSDDKKTYTFHLRDDIKWSNGDTLKASDFEFAWKRVLDPKLASPYAYQLYYLVNAEEYNTEVNTDTDKIGVKATDDTTLVVTLKQPTPYFESLVAFFTYYPLNEKNVKANETWAAEADTMVTNGPFTISEWNHNDSIVLKKNEDYREADKVSFTEVHMAMVSDPVTELSMYQTDQLDWSGRPTGEIPTEQIPSLKKDPEANLQIKGIASTYYFNFNQKAKPFDNVKIRKAFAMSIDRQQLVDKVTLGNQQPAFGFVPPGIKGEKDEFRTEVKDDYFKEDIDAAKKLLEEGMQEEGYTNETFPEVTFIHNEGEGHKKIATAVVDMWRTNLGIDVKVESQEWGVFLNNRTNLNYQVARAGWGADYNDPMTFIDMWTTNSGNNDIGFSNKEYDDLVKKAYASDKDSDRMDAMAKAEKILMEDVAICPVYYYTGIWMQKKYVNDVFIDYSGEIDYTRGYMAAE